MIRQGFPTATQFDGRDLFTTLPAPITQLLPIVTPGKMIVPPPIHTSSPIVTGKEPVRKNNSPEVSSQSFTKRSQASTGCVAV